MKVTKTILVYSIATAAGLAIAGTAQAQDRVLKVTNWGEYIAEDTIANFEAEYGIEVTNRFYQRHCFYFKVSTYKKARLSIQGDLSKLQ
jgi:spermidine/putrescine-binding protein